MDKRANSFVCSIFPFSVYMCCVHEQRASQNGIPNWPSPYHKYDMDDDAW